MASENIRTLTMENWNAEVMESEDLVIVDFWATWCPPCRAIAPAFESLADEFQGKMIFGKLDTEAQSAMALKYNVMTIPSFKVFRNGEEVQQLVGPRNKEHLKQFIESCL